MSDEAKFWEKAADGIMDTGELTGLPVHGYRAQPPEAVELVNQNKVMEERILRRMDLLHGDPIFDQRWLAIARTHIEQGFMALNRAIFQPERISLPEDDKDA